MLKFSLITIAALGIGMLIGCGGSGGTTIQTPEYKRAIDDYVMYAPVCEDKNKNSKVDDGNNFCTKTDYLGRFVLGNTYPLILVCKDTDGCKDFATNDKFVGKMSAPAGSTVLTPLTTLVQEYISRKETDENATVDPQDVENKLKEKLGIPKEIDIKNYDPIAEVEKHKDQNTTDSNASKEANKILAVQTQVQVILTATAKLSATDQQKSDNVEVVENMSKVAFNTVKVLIEDNNTSNNDNNESNNTETSNVLAKTDVLKKIIQNVITENNNSESNSISETNATIIAENLTKVLKVITEEPANIDRKKSAAVVKVVEELVDKKTIENNNMSVDINETITEKEKEVEKTIEENKKVAEQKEKENNNGLGGTSLTGGGSQ